jgi:cholesterol oxidase
MEPWRGTDVTSVIRFFDAAPEFTLAAPIFNRDTRLFLAGLTIGGFSWLRPLAPLFWRLLRFLVPLICRSGLLRRVHDGGDLYAAARLTNLFAIGRDNANRDIVLKGNTIDIAWDWRDAVAAAWDPTENTPSPPNARYRDKALPPPAIQQV